MNIFRQKKNQKKRQEGKVSSGKTADDNEDEKGELKIKRKTFSLLSLPIITFHRIKKLKKKRVKSTQAEKKMNWWAA